MTSSASKLVPLKPATAIGAAKPRRASVETSPVARSATRIAWLLVSAMYSLPTACKTQTTGFVKLRRLTIAAPGLATAQIGSRCRCGWTNFLDFVVVRIGHVEDVVMIGHPEGMLQPHLLLANAVFVAELKKPFAN